MCKMGPRPPTHRWAPDVEVSMSHRKKLYLASRLLRSWSEKTLHSC